MPENEIVNVEGLRKEEIVEDVPCGKSVTTKYFDAAGKLVRQDVHVHVAEGMGVGSDAGKVG